MHGIAAYVATHRAFLDGISIDGLLGLSAWIALACGRVSLGNTAFALIGAFATIDLAARHGWPVGLAAAAGVGIAGACGFVLGLALARVGVAQFAIATLVLGAFVNDVFLFSLRGGMDVDARTVQSHVAANVSTVHVLVALVLVALAVWLFVRSRHGRAFAAIAQDERAAASVGMDAARLRLLAITACALIAGLCGALAVLHRGSFEPGDFQLERNITALAVAVVGGSGSAAGPVIGAVAIGWLVLAVPSLKTYRAILDAALLLSFTVVLPGGLTSIAARVARQFSMVRASR